MRDVMREIYAPFNRNHDRIMFMNLRSAEQIKYAANCMCMLATKISFINQIAEKPDGNRLSANQTHTIETLIALTP
ncbi:hypothetical protein VD17_28950 [Pseudomonas fluorescens]|uniref:UDP-glucose 6-dehydrogenase n=1 Tax=Pseudomonas fluorescens TaxID=294 RepID=A0A0F4UXU9_PSEFL|nr:hypothetical protein VD17_28950 [Pseudomonas fluorescens]